MEPVKEEIICFCDETPVMSKTGISVIRRAAPFGKLTEFSDGERVILLDKYPNQKFFLRTKENLGLPVEEAYWATKEKNYQP